MNGPLKQLMMCVAMLPLLAGGPAIAAGGDLRGDLGVDRGVGQPVQARRATLADELLPSWIMRKADTNAPAAYDRVQLAQAADPRVSQLEEQIRNLTGKIEELNFQILQMQEQMRKVQEDNEFRFEELEKSKRSDAGGRQDRATASAAHGAAPRAGRDRDKVGASKDASSTASVSGNAGSADSTAIEPQTGSKTEQGVPPHPLGTIRFDANGNVIGETMDAPAASTGALPIVPQGGNAIASLPETDNPQELYQLAYQYILAGDYRAAETAFREHINRFPNDPSTADARFWLGESLYGQERYPEAATVFIDTQRDFPQSKRGAENLLKLGMTLARMKDHDVACATFAQVPTRYPSASPAVLERVTDERTKNRC
ncbi:tol-pal system protein YbgF [Phyllobacterium salinisoli]|uniref:Cell division coordinator CpoB n=1 Tax=Phyllobacterium salinisoli TaxID=1899321 RepID=A0A368K2U5_9HYPH|nr:tol-pal system protein YbgF [Phyllobacterium salinisoli]RCS23716.1 tol-pal system protein YbgF [Phyllobacterium salinisoli]